MRDTIFATSSGAPPAAIAVIRISGPKAFAIAGALVGDLPPPRRAAVRAIRNPRDNFLLDRALVLTFPGPRSATGEDVVELQVHGGRAVVLAIEAALADRPGARHAEAGEFTRRALENGVIDLTEAEGLGDLLAAQTETQRRAALRIAEGGLRAQVDRWTDCLVEIAARVEAQLDFSDEDDVAIESGAEIIKAIEATATEIAHLLDAPPVERLHDGVRVVLAGPPNSGKSTLLNALTGREAAIVSDISGTTRDRIDVPVARGGIAYLVTDTAGLTDRPGDAVERIGIERAAAAVASADIVVWLGDDPPSSADHLHVHGRADMADRAEVPPGRTLSLSAKTGAGVDALWDVIAARARALLPQEDMLTVNRRQRGLLAVCVTHLQAARGDDFLIVAEELRSALKALDAIAGRSGIENVLDAIFARFCIGK